MSDSDSDVTAMTHTALDSTPPVAAQSFTAPSLTLPLPSPFHPFPISSPVHGINSLLTPGHLENLGAGVAVMLVSLAVEGYSFKVALDTVRADAKQAGMSLRE